MLNRDDVLRVAKLSKLDLSEIEIEKYIKDLNSILSHMEELNELDVNGIEPLYNVLEIEDKLRHDVVENTLKKEDFLENAPERADDFISVFKMIGDDK